ncbi:MAG TPA: FAD-dependent oxidoreductase [Candidatus Hydrogenedentes bacterium]|nr:FAD-dependent oxidoreductase [Candidatus Hydrogenedentota bacterium]HOH34124.1 FAD-dependent oxidoreductase [Candidatus Hydrogenedentota bacterium]
MDQHDLNCDILVAGGGPAGVPCALAAARLGANVILCQDRPVLGGNASSEIRMHIVGADCSGGRGAELETETREGGIIEEIRLDTTVHNPQRSASMLDLILYDKCRAEPRLQLMLNTAVVGAKTQGTRVTHAIAHRESTEDRFTIAAKVFVDCTGDGRLGVEAQAPFRAGREGRDAFGESFAPETADDKTLGSSLLFMGRDLGHPVPFTPPPWARKFTEDDLEHRPHAQVGIDRGLEYGYWWLEWGGHLDVIKDNEVIRDELLAILLGIWDHIKNGGDHGADTWVLDWFGFVPGKRESRRFIGQYTLTQQDLQESRPFDDAIAYGGWPIDTHPPEGVDAPDEHPCMQRQLEHVYDIPLRACVSAGPRNLMFAGRNISATHIAFASTRVMATCAALGQGVGTAAAYAAKHNIEPADLVADPQSMTTIQQRLLRDDAYLIGAVNLDPNDRARDAKVAASSAQPNGGAAQVISGPTRSTHGPRGVKPERAAPGLHRWMSDPGAGLPAWIQLRWDKPVPLSELQLIFDTGMHRVLTLTQSDAYAARMEWGRPQPETVRDYTIEAKCADGWQSLVDVKGNYQRRRVHKVKPSGDVSALRVTVTATNGLDHARIFEIRAY